MSLTLLPLHLALCPSSAIGSDVPAVRQPSRERLPAAQPSSMVAAASALPDGGDDQLFLDRLLQSAPAQSTDVVQAVLDRATRRGSFYQWVLDYNWKEHRNRHEAIALSTAIDFLREGKHDLALEVLSRRAAAIQMADLHNNWKLAERVEWQYDYANLLPQELIASVARDTAAVERIERASRGGASTRGGRGRARGRWSNDSSRGSYSFNHSDSYKSGDKKNTGVGSKAGGAAGN